MSLEDEAARAQQDVAPDTAQLLHKASSSSDIRRNVSQSHEHSEESDDESESDDAPADVQSTTVAATNTVQKLAVPAKSKVIAWQLPADVRSEALELTGDR